MNFEKIQTNSLEKIYLDKKSNPII